MLFQYQKFHDIGSAGCDIVKTPLCSVRFVVSCPSWRASVEECSYVHELPRGAIVTGWQSERCHFELLLCPMGLGLAAAQQVDGCSAAMWRVRAHEQMEPLDFNACLLGLPAHVEIGPESGQGLDAQSWTADGQLIMLGTEDGDLLSQRARQRDWLPFRWHKTLAERFPQYLADGMTVRLPGLDAAELCQVQFVMSWSAEQQGQSDNSAFLAVDRRPDEILSSAGCT